MTGAQARTVIRTLPMTQLIHLSSIEFDPNTGEVHEPDEEPDHYPIPTPAVPSPPQQPAMPGGHRHRDASDPASPRAPSGPRNYRLAFALAFGSVIALIAITLTVVTVRASLNGGKTAESSTLVKVIQSLAQVTGVLIDPGGRHNNYDDPYTAPDPYTPADPNADPQDPPPPPPPEPPVQ